MYLASKVDVRFLLLPFLEAKDKYCPLDQLVPAVDGCDRFPLAWADSWGLDDICDVNDSFGDDMLLFRLNREKLLAWLKSRVQATATVIAARRQYMEGRRNQMKVEGFNLSSNTDNSTASSNDQGSTLVTLADTRIALQIVGDYLSTSTLETLSQAYGVSASEVQAQKATPIVKRKADWEEVLAIEQDRGASISMVGSVQARDLKKPTAASKAASATKKTAVKKTASSSSKKLLPPGRGVQGIASFFSKK